MPLHPFTLAETEEYFQKNGFRWKRLNLLQVYMAIGGVPYYKYQLDKDEFFKISHRIEAFEEETQTTSTILPTMITTFGLAKGMYSDQITTKLTLDDLF